jgi:hypothetical protein
MPVARRCTRPRRERRMRFDEGEPRRKDRRSGAPKPLDDLECLLARDDVHECGRIEVQLQ